MVDLAVLRDLHGLLDIFV